MCHQLSCQPTNAVLHFLTYGHVSIENICFLKKRLINKSLFVFFIFHQICPILMVWLSTGCPGTCSGPVMMPTRSRLMLPDWTAPSKMLSSRAQTNPTVQCSIQYWGWSRTQMHTHTHTIKLSCVATLKLSEIAHRHPPGFTYNLQQIQAEVCTKTHTNNHTKSVWQVPLCVRSQ